MKCFNLFLIALLTACLPKPAIDYPTLDSRIGNPVLVYVPPRQVIPAPSPEQFQPRDTVWDFTTQASPPANSVHEEELRRANEEMELQQYRLVRTVCHYSSYSCMPYVHCYYNRSGVLTCN